MTARLTSSDTTVAQSGCPSARPSVALAPAWIGIAAPASTAVASGRSKFTGKFAGKFAGKVGPDMAHSGK
ncbi:hypothetical protein GCM10027081_58630 [Cupriavidus yeoncheonensis]